MKYLYTLSLFIALFPLVSFSQSYKPGYVVTTKGDTLKGYVGFRRPGKNPAEIYFKKSISEVKKDTFNVTNAVAFGENDVGNYYKFRISLTQDLPDDPDIRIGKDTTTISEVVFLKLITAGKNLQLYSYIDPIKERYIISEQGRQPYELIYHEFHNPDRQMDEAFDFTYKIQLQKLRIAFRPKDLSLIDKIQLAGYTHDDMYEIVAQLNNEEISPEK